MNFIRWLNWIVFYDYRRCREHVMLTFYFIRWMNIKIIKQTITYTFNNSVWFDSIDEDNASSSNFSWTMLQYEPSSSECTIFQGPIDKCIFFYFYFTHFFLHVCLNVLPYSIHSIWKIYRAMRQIVNINNSIDFCLLFYMATDICCILQIVNRLDFPKNKFFNLRGTCLCMSYSVCG